MYFLWYLIRKEKTVVYESVATARVWVFSPGSCRSFSGKANTENCSELMNHQTCFLFDAKAGDNCHEPCACPALLALFTSPNLASHKQTARRNNIITFGYTSPTLKELMLLGGAFNISSQEVVRKYMKFGPDIRFVIGTFESVAEECISQAIARFNSTSIVTSRNGEKSDMTSKDNPAVLFKTTAKEAEHDTFADAYLWSNVEWSFASKCSVIL